MKKENKMRPENKKGFPSLLLIFIIGLVVVLAFQNFSETKVASVSFSHQLEHLVNLDLIDPSDSRKMAGNDNLVFFSGKFRDHLTETARDRYRYLSLLNQHHDLLFDKNHLASALTQEKEDVLHAALFFLQITDYNLSHPFVVIPSRFNTNGRDNSVAIKEVSKDQSTVTLAKVKRYYEEAFLHPTAENVQILGKALEDLIQEFRSPKLGIGSESQKRSLRESEVLIQTTLADSQKTLQEKIQVFARVIEGINGLVADMLRPHEGIALYDLRSVRNYLDSLQNYDKVIADFNKNAAQLDKIRAKVASTTWFFNNHEISTKTLESKSPEEFHQWFAGGATEWNHFSQNKGLTFSAVDQPRTKVLETRFKSEEPAPNYFSYFFTFLPIILIAFVLYFIFSRQMKGMGSSAMNFGKSPAKLLNQGTQRVTFDDVAGIDEAKEELEEVVDFLKDPARYTKLGAKIPKGVLLIGAPGTGKTLIAKAVAGEAGVPFFSISGSDFVEMFVGVGASRVRDLFDQARKNAPCIIFIDEIDAVGRHRGSGLGGGHDEREQTLNQLLVEIDGMGSSSGIIIIAATNRPDVLDKALLRPGRFDRSVFVSLPDFGGRYAILKVHIKKIKIADDVDLKHLASRTAGCSGADLANMVNEGAIHAAKKRRTAVTQEDLLYAYEKINFGKERRSLEMEKEDMITTAWHEAGHALLALIKKSTDPVVKVTRIPRGGSLGSTLFQPKTLRVSYKKEELKTQLCVLMGGRCAEEILSQDPTSGAQMDIRQATSLAKSMVCEWGMSEKVGMVNFSEGGDQSLISGFHEKGYSEETAKIIDQEIKRLLDEAYNEAMRILRENYDKLKFIAEMLIQFETLEREDLDKIMEGRFDPTEKQAKIDAFAGAKRKLPPPIPDELVSKYKKSFKQGNLPSPGTA